MDSDRLQIVYMPVDSLQAYERNPRLNSEAVPLLMASIRDFGFKVPIVVDSDNVIVAGHTRLKAAKALGMTEVPCIVADDLTPAQIKAFRLADNKVAEIAGWDFDMLDLELAELEDDFDMGDFGFILDDYDDDEIMGEPSDPQSEIMGDVPEAEEFEEFEVEEEALVGETIVKTGDRIHLGRHTLRCGDSLSADDLDDLLRGEVVDMAFTSPPYNAGHMDIDRAENGRKYLRDEDVRPEEEYDRFLQDSVALQMERAHEVFINIGILKGSKRSVVKLLNHHLDNFKDLIYWKKSNPVPALAHNHISSATELIIAFGKDGSRVFRHDPGIWYGVIEGPWGGGNPYSKVHRATFPLYLPTEMINRLTPEGATVMDCFGGTGTTLIACEDTGRTCYMQEMEPAYCDIIVRRYIEKVGTDKDVFIERDGEEIRPDWTK